MTTMSIRLAKSLHRRLRELAKSEGVSMNQLINSAVGEKLAALMTADYLEERARRGSRRKYEAVLRKVADKTPEKFDTPSEGPPRRTKAVGVGKRLRKK